ncbi:hypothetical protein MNBD_DELTA01-1161 [hydrothermal vent metagenome]|uniref:TIR domain-containing protein n=1 Tax=hydrothermal vent metagenome TaxID=652676 RepID=A0A3B0QV80_9ZZZZ
MNNANIFVSYSHKDKKWKNHVVAFLELISRASGFKYQTWHDDEIGLGKKWKEEIDKAMTSAQVAVLLISPDFLNSKFILENEVPKLQKYDKEGSLLMIPLIVRPCPWELFDWLSPIQGYLDDSVILSGCNEHEMEKILTKFSREVNRIIIDRASETEAEAEKELNEAGTTTNAPKSSQLNKSEKLLNIAPDKTRKFCQSSIDQDPFTMENELKGKLTDSNGFLTRAGIIDLIKKTPKNTSSEDVVDIIKIFQTRKQRTWLVATCSLLLCVLDDKKTAMSGRRVQWSLPLTEAYPIVIKARPARVTGLVSIGPKQNWLYSQKMHPDPAQLKTKIKELVEKSRLS